MLREAIARIASAFLLLALVWWILLLWVVFSTIARGLEWILTLMARLGKVLNAWGGIW
jgi:hypothetical protein